jgi:hypothetical protein
MQLCMDACAGLAALHTRGLPHPDLAARTCVLNRYRGDATSLHQWITQKMAVGSEDRSSYKGSEFELESNNDKILRFDQNELSVVHNHIFIILLVCMCIVRVKMLLKTVKILCWWITLYLNFYMFHLTKTHNSLITEIITKIKIIPLKLLFTTVLTGPRINTCPWLLHVVHF